MRNIILDLIQVATEAKAHYQVWWAIEHDGRAIFPQELNRFVDFFEATRVAHFRSMIIAAWKPFDQNKKVSSFKSLLARGEALLSPGDISAVQAHINGALIIDRLKEIRHSFVAHQNLKLNVEEVFERANITPNKLRNLVYETANLVNMIARSHGISNVVFESERSFDSTMGLLRALQIEKISA